MKIKIENQEFELNVDKAKELGILSPINKICVGQVYHSKLTQREYIIAQIRENFCIFINIGNGRRLCNNNGVEVANVDEISDDEFQSLSDHDHSDMVLVRDAPKK